jgi:hypothetical protein
MNLGIQRNLRQWLLRGDNVHCPCCKKHFLAFWFFGKPIRFSALCPSCGSLERHRLLWLFLFEERRGLIADGTKLLHIAPERVFFKKFKRENKIQYFPADKFMPGHHYPQRLMQAGFQVECVDFCNTFSEKDQIRLGLDREGIIYLCKKE